MRKLTLDAKLEGVRAGRAVQVGGSADVEPRGGAPYALQDQALVALYHPARHVLPQLPALGGRDIYIMSIRQLGKQRKAQEEIERLGGGERDLGYKFRNIILMGNSYKRTFIFT